MVRKRKLVVCICGQVGRRKRNAVIMRFSYPQDTVAVPNVSQFETVADAWDYSAKVFLRLSQRALENPPVDEKLDSQIAQTTYEHFRTILPHSDDDINYFESIHTQRIKERQAICQVNPDAKVSRMSLSLLYGAIVCTVMSNKLFNPYHAIFKGGEVERKVAYAIYTFYSQLLIDERAKTTWVGWYNIVYDFITKVGPGAAAKKHANEVAGGSLTRKQVKDKKSEVINKALDDLRYRPVFESLLRSTGQLIKSNTNAAAYMLNQFERFQFEVYDQERKYEYAWVIHDKTQQPGSNDEFFQESRRTSIYSKKSKSNWCEISPYQSLRIVSNNVK